VETAYPIFKLSRLVRVHTYSHHNGHNKIIFAERKLDPYTGAKLMVNFKKIIFAFFRPRSQQIKSTFGNSVGSRILPFLRDFGILAGKCLFWPILTILGDFDLLKL